jgi:putative intracellular protease/amidase
MRVPIPLPDRDFDVTEVAVPWRVLRDAGHQAVFATEQAGPSPRRTPDCSPGCYSGTWAALDVTAFDGLLLPGGHTSGMRQYLGSSALREQVARF